MNIPGKGFGETLTMSQILQFFMPYLILCWQQVNNQGFEENKSFTLGLCRKICKIQKMIKRLAFVDIDSELKFFLKSIFLV